MKKIVLCFCVAISLYSCKKDKKSEIAENYETDSVIVPESNEITEVAAPFKATEITADQAKDFLKAKENDTLYITNFFATWCGPCMKEIPHFKEKMNELQGKPVKFTFVSLDDKTEWNESVKNFAEENNLSKNIVLLDGSQLAPEFFKNNFKQWDGGSIPFTLMKKGSKSDETVGMMSKEMLDSKINSFLQKGEKTIKLNDDYNAGTINQPAKM